MKANVHPQYFDQVQVSCACGNVFMTGSTKQSIKVEICSACHPFYTGQQKFIDTVGKVQKFQAKQQVAAVRAATVKKKVEEKKEDQRPRTLREMLMASK